VDLGDERQEKRGEPTPWWEWLVILLTIPVIWMVLLGWGYFIRWIALGIFGVLLVWILVRKITRLHRLRDEVQREKGQFPPGGFPPYTP
jgi:fatty acid desaturase